MATTAAAASETVFPSRVSRWRKVGVGLASASVRVWKRLLCMFAEGWSLASQKLGILGPLGPVRGSQEAISWCM